MAMAAPWLMDDRLGVPGDHHRHMEVALDEAGKGSLRLGHDLDLVPALEDLLPDDLELHLGEAIADAAVDAEAEGEVLAGAFAIDDQVVGPQRDLHFVAVARDVPHHD